MKKKVGDFIYWVFKVSYQYRVVKYNNPPISAVFFVSFIFTNFVNFILNITLFTFVMDEINVYYYLTVLIFVTISGNMFFLKSKNILKIPKRKPTSREIILLDIVFFGSAILFFSSLALIT